MCAQCVHITNLPGSRSSGPRGHHMAVELAQQKEVQMQFMLFMSFHCKLKYGFVQHEERLVLLHLLKARCIALNPRGMGGSGRGRGRVEEIKITSHAARAAEMIANCGLFCGRLFQGTKVNLQELEWPY